MDTLQAIFTVSVPTLAVLVARSGKAPIKRVGVVTTEIEADP